MNPKQKSQKQKNTKKLDNLISVVTIFGLCSIFLFVIGIMNIENYFNWIRFIAFSVFSGVILGCMTYYFSCSFEPKAKTYKNAQGFKLIHILILAFVLASFGLCRLINESDSNEMNCEKYAIKEMGESGSASNQPGRRTYYVFINTGNGPERISFGKKFNENHSIGDTINLCLIRGKLGLEYYKIKKP